MAWQALLTSVGVNVLQGHRDVHGAGQSLDERAMILLAMVTPTGAVEAAQDECHRAGAKGGADGERGWNTGEVRVVSLRDRHAHEGSVAGACHWVLPLREMKNVLEEPWTVRLVGRCEDVLDLIGAHDANHALDDQHCGVGSAGQGSLQCCLLGLGDNEAEWWAA